MKPDHPGLVIEEPMMLPHGWYALGEMAFRDEPRPAATAPVERNGYVTFGTANNPYKYGREVVSAWAPLSFRPPRGKCSDFP
jgi:hypothetical protein